MMEVGCCSKMEVSVSAMMLYITFLSYLSFRSVLQIFLSAVILILLNKGRYDFARHSIYSYHFFITKVLVNCCL